MAEKQVVKTTTQRDTSKVKSTPVAPKKAGLSVQTGTRAGFPLHPHNGFFGPGPHCVPPYYC